MPIDGPHTRSVPWSLLPLGTLVLALLVGCAVRPEFPNSGAPPAATAALPPPLEIDQRKSADEQLAELRQVIAETTEVPRLGRGDVLNVAVYDEPELTVAGIPVRPDGKISYPLVGDVQAEGRSVEELTADLTARLRAFLLAPKVSVIVTNFNSLSYVINGQVATPGVYPLVSNVTLTSAVAKAGGLRQGSFRGSSVELADLTHALISRRGRLLPVDFVGLLHKGDLRFDVQLQSGDYISIPSGLSAEVYVLGEVNNPSALAFRDEMPMSKTLALAGGFTNDADLKRVHVIRGSLSNPTLIVSDFKKLIAGEQQDVQLMPGDLVFVPPVGLAVWTRMLAKILPTLTAFQTGVVFSKTLTGK